MAGIHSLERALFDTTVERLWSSSPNLCLSWAYSGLIFHNVKRLL